MNCKRCGHPDAYGTAEVNICPVCRYTWTDHQQNEIDEVKERIDLLTIEYNQISDRLEEESERAEKLKHQYLEVYELNAVNKAAADNAMALLDVATATINMQTEVITSLNLTIAELTRENENA